MESDVVIRVEGLGKRYTLGTSQKNGSYTALRDVLAEKAKSLVRRPFPRRSHGDSRPSENDFWALKDVSFEVGRGEVVGIIGRNGAGKSTLLKILSRITEPTEGTIRLRGRVASLLEVGTGFHPELTGRENIFLNGAILGMHRHEIKAKFDEIVAFAEVERFLDTPVKRYSSGMYVRLAFAVAAHLEPEILIIDEVLAVGDAQFQKKCLGKMEQVAKGGRTVIFVSHNINALRTLCTMAVRLKQGRLIGHGSIHDEAASYAKEQNPLSDTNLEVNTISASVCIRGLFFEPNPAEATGNVAFTLSLGITRQIRIHELVILIYSAAGARVAILDLRNPETGYYLADPGLFKIDGNIRQSSLVEGDYSVGLYLNCDEYKGNIFDLYNLLITSKARNDRLVAYPPNDRGIVDLAYDFSVT